MTELNNSDLPKSGSEVIDSKGFMTRAWYTYFRKLPGSIQALLASVEAIVVDLAGYVPVTRTISTTAPLAGGGDLSADLTLTHNDTAVTPGTYTLATVTVDAKGHVTSAANGVENGQTPTFIAVGETFTVQEYKQVLFSQTIVVEGTLTVNGVLIGV